MTDSLVYYHKLLEEVGQILEKINVSDNGMEINITYREDLTDAIKTVRGGKEVVKQGMSSVIYNYYKRPASVVGIPHFNYLTKLREKYRSDAETSRFRSGWIVEENAFDEHGSILIRKDNYYTKQVLAGAYLVDQYPIREGMPVQARWHLTSNNGLVVQDTEVSSFYEASGTTLPNDYKMSDVWIRFYFNIDVNAPNFESKYLDFFGRVTAELNVRFIPFQFKIIYQSQNIGRADAAVLYMDKRYFFLAIDFILNLQTEFSGLFGNLTPMFTYELSPGIGFAEQPPFDKADNLHFNEVASFGEHRSALIAGGIVDCYLANRQNPGFDPKNAAFLLDFMSNLNSSAGATIFHPRLPNGRRDSGIVKSAFFLNRKSADYPYVVSYFDSASFSKMHGDSKSQVMGTVKDSLETKQLAAAELVGYKLCSEAIWDANNRCSWITFNSPQNYSTVNNGLADGLAGIVLFLDLLCRNVTSKSFELHRSGAAKCLSYKLRDKIDWVTKRKDKELVEARRLEHGYFSGDLAAIIVLKNTGLDTLDVSMLSAKKVLGRLKAPDFTLESPYIYDGIAGTILALCKMSSSFNDKNYLHGARQLGLILIKHLFVFKSGQYELQVKGLGIGFNFGVSGIACALLKLQSMLPGEGFDINGAVDCLLAYERLKKTGTFWDFPNGQLKSDIWYRGMIDMVVSRIELMKYMPGNVLVKSELIDALTYVNSKISLNSYGIFEDRTFNFGLADLTLSLNLIGLPNKTWAALINDIYKEIDDDSVQFVSPIFTKGFVPGLQGGYAGLGYFLLKCSALRPYESVIVPE